MLVHVRPAVDASVSGSARRRLTMRDVGAFAREQRLADVADEPSASVERRGQQVRAVGEQLPEDGRIALLLRSIFHGGSSQRVGVAAGVRRRTVRGSSIPTGKA